MFPSSMGSSANAVASLARAFAKEIENLPTRYLREFYRIKVKDDVEALPSPDSPNFKARYKRVSRELRKLEAANNGSSTAYEHVLSLAYGRKGKLRRELLEPLLSDPAAPLPPRIIPTLESSRPPVYSPELIQLLGSTLSRDCSIRTARQLQFPSLLPSRAAPTTSDARILGPLDRGREVNLRWRFFKSGTAKLQPPIEASRMHILQTSTREPAKDGATEESNAENTEPPTPPPVGFQGTSVLRDLEAIASPNPNIPKRARGSTLQDPPLLTTPTSTVNRFIRRQHRKILAKIPILTYSKHPNSPIAKYQVSLSPLAHSGSSNELSWTVPMADEADLAWLRLPPLPNYPNTDLASTRRGPGAKMSLSAESKLKSDQNDGVDEPLKNESP